jgi:hypothetical protein
MEEDVHTVKDKSQISFMLLGRIGIRVLLVTGPIARVTRRTMTGTTGKCPTSRSRRSFTVTALEIAKVSERIERYLPYVIGEARREIERVTSRGRC